MPVDTNDDGRDRALATTDAAKKQTRAGDGSEQVCSAKDGRGVCLLSVASPSEVSKVFNDQSTVVVANKPAGKLDKATVDPSEVKVTGLEPAASKSDPISLNFSGGDSGIQSTPTTNIAQRALSQLEILSVDTTPAVPIKPAAVAVEAPVQQPAVQAQIQPLIQPQAIETAASAQRAISANQGLDLPSTNVATRALAQLDLIGLDQQMPVKPMSKLPDIPASEGDFSKSLSGNGGTAGTAGRALAQLDLTSLDPQPLSKIPAKTLDTPATEPDLGKSLLLTPLPASSASQLIASRALMQSDVLPANGINGNAISTGTAALSNPTAIADKSVLNVTDQGVRALTSPKLDSSQLAGSTPFSVDASALSFDKKVTIAEARSADVTNILGGTNGINGSASTSGHSLTDVSSPKAGSDPVPPLVSAPALVQPVFTATKQSTLPLESPASPVVVASSSAVLSSATFVPSPPLGSSSSPGSASPGAALPAEKPPAGPQPQSLSFSALSLDFGRSLNLADTKLLDGVTTAPANVPTRTPFAPVSSPLSDTLTAAAPIQSSTIFKSDRPLADASLPSVNSPTVISNDKQSEKAVVQPLNPQPVSAPLVFTSLDFNRKLTVADATPDLGNGQAPLAKVASATVDQSLRSTTDQSLRGTTDQTLRSTTDQSLRGTTDQTLRSTTDQSLRSTTDQTLRSTTDQSLRSTTDQSMRSTSDQPNQTIAAVSSAPLNPSKISPDSVTGDSALVKQAPIGPDISRQTQQPLRSTGDDVRAPDGKGTTAQQIAGADGQPLSKSTATGAKDEARVKDDAGKNSDAATGAGLKPGTASSIAAQATDANAAAKGLSPGLTITDARATTATTRTTDGIDILRVGAKDSTGKDILVSQTSASPQANIDPALAGRTNPVRLANVDGTITLSANTQADSRTLATTGNAAGAVDAKVLSASSLGSAGADNKKPTQTHPTHDASADARTTRDAALLNSSLLASVNLTVTGRVLADRTEGRIDAKPDARLVVADYRQIGGEPRSEMRTNELRTDLRPEVKTEPRIDTRTELRNELRNELRTDVRIDTRIGQTAGEHRGEVKSDLVPAGMRTEQRIGEIRPEVKPELVLVGLRAGENRTAENRTEGKVHIPEGRSNLDARTNLPEPRITGKDGAINHEPNQTDRQERLDPRRVVSGDRSNPTDNSDTGRGLPNGLILGPNKRPDPGEEDGTKKPTQKQPLPIEQSTVIITRTVKENNRQPEIEPIDPTTKKVGVTGVSGQSTGNSPAGSSDPGSSNDPKNTNNTKDPQNTDPAQSGQPLSVTTASLMTQFPNVVIVDTIGRTKQEDAKDAAATKEDRNTKDWQDTKSQNQIIEAKDGKEGFGVASSRPPRSDINFIIDGPPKQDQTNGSPSAIISATTENGGASGAGTITESSNGGLIGEIVRIFGVKGDKDPSEELTTAQQVALLLNFEHRPRYRINKGDSLISIARRVLGSSILVPLIVELNAGNLYIGADGTAQLHPGKELILPSQADIVRYLTTSQSTLFSDKPFNLSLAAHAGQNLEQVEYICRLGDNLKSVAKRHPHLQDARLWVLVAKLNQLTVRQVRGEPVATLRRGQKLILPSKNQMQQFLNDLKKPRSSDIHSAAGQESHQESVKDSVQEPLQEQQHAITDGEGGLTVVRQGETKVTGPMSEQGDSNDQRFESRVVTNEGEIKGGRVLTLQINLAGDWLPMVEYKIGNGNSSVEFRTIDGRCKLIWIELPDKVAMQLAHADLASNVDHYYASFRKNRFPF